MNVLVAIDLLLAGMTKWQAFATAIAQARAEGRDLTPAEVALSRDSAQAALDAIDAKIKAAGG
jgi:hypothetical protein